MGIPIAKKLMKTTCEVCRVDAVRIGLSDSKQQVAIYDSVVAGDGKLDVGQISSAVNLDQNVVAVILGRMRRAGILKPRKSNEDYRRTYYSRSF